MQRRQLVGVFKLLLLVGGILIILPFIKTTGMFKTTSPEAKGMLVDVSEIKPGQYQVVKDRVGREFWVYRWSIEDRQRHDVSDSQQAWSVLLPYEPHRGCRVHLREDMTTAMRFIEPCFNAGFDVNGRRLAETGIAEQRDLPAIPYQWQNESSILLLLGTRSE